MNTDQAILKRIGEISVEIRNLDVVIKKYRVVAYQRDANEFRQRSWALRKERRDLIQKHAAILNGIN